MNPEVVNAGGGRSTRSVSEHATACAAVTALVTIGTRSVYEGAAADAGPALRSGSTMSSVSKRAGRCFASRLGDESVT